ncbi:MAG: DUF29 domain-containing protein [Candidatus Magnetoovum sp. WYHC-5]|nr:DUF29 domain-containing protein [Candidatus Magnetoovum sp. WYHC-5]
MDSPNTVTHITNISTEQSLYERDFYQWALHNAELLKQGKLAEIDIYNIAEELEDMGRNNKRELESRLAILIMHLLKWQYQAKHRCRSWITTINTQRMDIELLLKNSPSLKHKIEITIEESFVNAKRLFENETSINQNILPETCPYTFEEIINHKFRPEK